MNYNKILCVKIMDSLNEHCACFLNELNMQTNKILDKLNAWATEPVFPNKAGAPLAISDVNFTTCLSE